MSRCFQRRSSQQIQQCPIQRFGSAYPLCEQHPDVDSVLEGLEGTGVAQCRTVYVSLLKRCAESKSLVEGKQIHDHVVKNGFDRFTIVGNLLIHMYGRCRSIEDACRAFSTLRSRNVFSWITLISAYAQNGHLLEAESLFQKLPQHSPAAFNSMITAFGQNGQIQGAKKMFDLMPHREAVSWNALLVGYAKNGHSKQAYKLFQDMILEGEEPNKVTFLGILDACGNLGWIWLARAIHSEIIQSGIELDVFVGTAILSTYGRCGSVEEARLVFERMPEKNTVSWTSMAVAYGQNGRVEEAECIFYQNPAPSTVSWTAMVSAYAQNGHSEKALQFFKLMDLEGFRPNSVTFTSGIDACAEIGAVEQGRILHSEAAASGIPVDVHVGGALVNMYGRRGCCSEAKAVYDDLAEKNEIVATALICAYAQNGDFLQALRTFQALELEGFKPTGVTFVSILEACEEIHTGRSLHHRMKASGLEFSTITATALITMYRRCKSVHEARNIFDQLLNKNVITWTAMIGAYVENGEERQALELFKRMVVEGTMPDDIILSSIFVACANLSDLVQGRIIHRSLEDGNFQVQTGLIDMYGKCGSVEDAKQVFDTLARPDMITWTSMVTAYAQNSQGEEALRLFRTMELQGVEINEVGLVSVLAACSHSGMIDEGLSYFFSIAEDRGLVILPEHYVCLIDLLGRMGKLELAESLTKSLPLEMDTIVAWTALLGACRTHGDEKRAEKVAQKLIELDPKLSSSYILLSSAHAVSSGDLEPARNTAKQSVLTLARRLTNHAMQRFKRR